MTSDPGIALLKQACSLKVLRDQARKMKVWEGQMWSGSTWHVHALPQAIHFQNCEVCASHISLRWRVGLGLWFRIMLTCQLMWKSGETKADQMISFSGPSFFFSYLLTKKLMMGFPWWLVQWLRICSAGDTGSIPSLGGSHMQWSS